MPRPTLLQTLTTLLALTTLPTHATSAIETTFTTSTLLTIAPETATCASSLPECIPARLAAPAIAIAFHNFNISTFGAQAALLSLILFESGSLKYSRNHFPAPGVPGQGTRNMQSPAYNLKYAQWLAGHCVNCGISEDQVGIAEKAGPEAVLELVNGPQWGVASASWFARTQCDGGVLEALADGQEGSWEGYLTGCVGTGVTEERRAGWRKVVGLGKW